MHISFSDRSGCASTTLEPSMLSEAALAMRKKNTMEFPRLTWTLPGAVVHSAKFWRSSPVKKQLRLLFSFAYPQIYPQISNRSDESLREIVGRVMSKSGSVVSATVSAGVAIPLLWFVRVKLITNRRSTAEQQCWWPIRCALLRLFGRLLTWSRKHVTSPTSWTLEIKQTSGTV